MLKEVVEGLRKKVARLADDETPVALVAGRERETRAGNSRILEVRARTR